MFSVIGIVLALTATCFATSPLPVCVRDGKTYQVGESFQPTPCEHCFCSPDGRDVCAVADCFFTPCVDAVHDPTKCCPQCPNGIFKNYLNKFIIFYSIFPTIDMKYKQQ